MAGNMDIALVLLDELEYFMDDMFDDCRDVRSVKGRIERMRLVLNR